MYRYDNINLKLRNRYFRVINKHNHGVNHTNQLLLILVISQRKMFFKHF